jgi:ribosomal protein S18 acetylase RimI-like enzyme
MSIAIRRATIGDAPVISEFNRLLALESEGKVLDPDVVRAGVAALLNDASRGLYFVAESGREIVGQTMVRTEWSDWRNAWVWWIESVYVRSDVRRQGVFRALYDHIYRTASADLSVAGLRLYVEQNNHAAQQAYRRLGMEPMNFFLFHKFPLREQP